MNYIFYELLNQHNMIPVSQNSLFGLLGIVRCNFFIVRVFFAKIIGMLD